MTSLPMDDVIFLGLLRKKNLFLCDLQEQVHAKSTKAERLLGFGIIQSSPLYVLIQLSRFVNC